MSTTLNVIQIAQELIRRPSYLGDGHDECEVSSFIADFAQTLGYRVETQKVIDGRFNVVIRSKDDSPIRLAFFCHADTVENLAGWTRNPFAGEIDGDRLYGRGACDMKGGIACALHALQECAGRPGIAMIVDIDEEEEFRGMKHLLKNMPLDLSTAKLIVFTEPGPERGSICNCHRGFLQFDCTIRGKAAHADAYDDGASVIRAMGAMEEWLRPNLHNYFQMSGLGGTGFMFCSAEAGCDMGESRIARGRSVVPDIAHCQVNVRPASFELGIKELTHFLDQAAAQQKVSIKITAVHDFFGPLYVEPDALAEMTPIVNAVFGTHSFRRMGGYGEGEMIFRALDRKVPVVYFGPTPDSTEHQPHEWVSIESLDKTSLAYQGLIAHYCG